MGKPLRVLIIEDSEEDTRLLLRELLRDGYTPVHKRIECAGELTSALDQQLWDVVISDYSIPDFGAMAALKLVEERGYDLPFIIVSGTISEEAAVAAMKAGAHDYVMKNNLKRLAPALERELREGKQRRQHKQAEAALRESQERFRELTENIREVFWLTNLDKNKMLYISPGYEQIWGRSCESLYLSPQTWLDAIHPEDKPRITEAALSRQPTGEYDEQYRIVRPDNSIRYIRDRAFPIRDQSGSVYRIAGIAEDITERREAEEDLCKSQEELRQAQKMEAIGRLAGGIAHDFNNLLTVILSYSQLLLERLRPDDRNRPEVEEILMAGRDAASLTGQLLAFSRRQVIQPQVLDLNKQVGNMEIMLRRLIGEDITLQISKDPDLGLVLADPGQIQQVIMNLVVNARDAMPQGGCLTIKTAGVELGETSTAFKTTVPPGRYVMLAVRDTGVGMDAETQARLFEPFFTTKELGKGTGLGLSIVYGIVQQSNGAIRVYSEPGQGTTFKIFFPMVPAEVDQPAPTPIIVEAHRGSETVLMVEDYDSVRELTRKILEQSGYTALVARDGQEALRICASHSGGIHVLLTDIILPGMNGLDLAKRILLIRPEIKVVYMSGYTDKLIGQLSNPNLKSRFLPKPFSLETLSRTIREALGS